MCCGQLMRRSRMVMTFCFLLQILGHTWQYSGGACTLSPYLRSLSISSTLSHLRLLSQFKSRTQAVMYFSISLMFHTSQYAALSVHSLYNYMSVSSSPLPRSMSLFFCSLSNKRKCWNSRLAHSALLLFLFAIHLCSAPSE